MWAGGAERMISSLANYYAEQEEIEVIIGVLDKNPSFYRLHPNVELLNLYELHQSKNIWQSIKNTIIIIIRTRQAFKDWCPDYVICFSIKQLVFALVAKSFLKIKIIGSERNNPNHYHDPFWNSMKKVATPFADGFIFQTEGAREYYPQRVQQKSAVIPNGILVDNFPTTILPPSERIPGSICAVGRLHEQKDYHTLINAFAVFVQTHPLYSLTIYGEGIERERLEQLIKKLKLEDKVILAGRIQNVIQEISKRKIYVLSSKFEGMPNTLMEGMACGCACISTDCNYGPRDLIVDGENGILVPVGDIDAMAAAMHKLASNKELLNKISYNASNIRNTHSMDGIGERYLEFLTKTSAPGNKSDKVRKDCVKRHN